jgi:hypothetical protein
MHAIDIGPRYLLLTLTALPFLAFGTFVAWNVASVVIREVVPVVVTEVVRALF